MNLNWDGAACVGRGELFFGPDDERTHERRARERAAKAVCAGCPVAAGCRAWAITTAQPAGVWGGLSEHELTRLRNARRPAASGDKICTGCGETKPLSAFFLTLGRPRYRCKDCTQAMVREWKRRQREEAAA